MTAPKILLSQVTSLESAKARADHQMVFLEEVTRPNKPDYPSYPTTGRTMVISILCFYGLYIMGRLLVSGAREHRLK